MNSVIVSETWIYPIKSMGGIRIKKSLAVEKGLQHDRRWMLIDEAGNFISQRQHTSLALFKVSIVDSYLLVQFKGSAIQIPLTISNQTIRVSKVWSSLIQVHEAPSELSEWFRAPLNFKCRLVFFLKVNQEK